MTVKELLDVVSTAGALGFMVIAVWAFATGRIVPIGTVREQASHFTNIVEYEREQKRDALEVARAALESHDRLADAVEERNRLDRERLTVARRR